MHYLCVIELPCGVFGVIKRGYLCKNGAYKQKKYNKQVFYCVIHYYLCITNYTNVKVCKDDDKQRIRDNHIDYDKE